MPVLRRNAAIWISKLPEIAFNQFYTLGADFLKVRTSNPTVLVPRIRKFTDAGQAGNGHEFVTQVCNERWLPLTLELDDIANFDAAGRLELRSVSGAVTDTEIETGLAWSHRAPMQNVDTLQLKSFNVISQLAGASYLCGGGVVERARMFQEGAAAPRIQYTILTSGKHKSPHAVASLPALPTALCPKAKVEVHWTDSDGLRDFATSACELRGWSVDLVNNHQPSDDECGADPEQVAGDPAVTEGPSAAQYNSKLSHNDRISSAQITIYTGGTMPDWIKMAENEGLTDVTFSILGPLLAPGVPAKLTRIFPQAVIESIDEVDSNGKSALQLNILPMFDPVSGGNMIVEVVNGLSGLSPDYN
jgi:hypothetical protein